ncbi:MAG: class I tRNA ligase family protein, partial [Halobacteriota archaeon]
DLHRPKVDSVTFECECGGEMRRVEDVFDVWFDSGVASWGTLKYPLEDDGRFKELWPADFITEGHDQTRGWFYSQLGAGVVAHGRAPYKTVLTHGFTLDDQGRKMSKSIGNVVDPEEVAEQVGVDCFRLYSLSSALWEDLRFNWDEVKNYNRVLNIFWNTIRFAHLYMSLDQFKETEVKEFNTEDKWIISRLESFNRLAVESLDEYQLHRIVRAFQYFIVEDFSRWYIQLIRNRVWEERDSPSKIAAYSTILKVVDKTSRIMGPYIPYLTEWVHQHFTKEFKDSQESLFMESYPLPAEELIDEELETHMASVRGIYESASNARQKANIKLRWPLRKLYIESSDQSVKAAVSELSSLIKSQCNVKEVEVVDEFPKTVSLKPNFKALGPLLKEKAQDFASYISSLSEEEIKEVVEKGTIGYEGQEFNVSEVLSVEYSVPDGYQIADFSGGFVYLYTERDDELIREGYARELVRRIQEMRKEMDLNVDDFIHVRVDISPQLLDNWLNYIKTETRAEKLEFGPPQDGYTKQWDIEGKKVNIGLNKI